MLRDVKQHLSYLNKKKYQELIDCDACTLENW